MRRDDDRDDPKRDASCRPSDASVSHAEARALCGTVVPTASRAGSEEQHDEPASPIGCHCCCCCCCWESDPLTALLLPLGCTCCNERDRGEREREDRDQCREQKSQRAHLFAASKKPVKWTRLCVFCLCFEWMKRTRGGTIERRFCRRAWNEWIATVIGVIIQRSVRLSEGKCC